jgi:hypothetical protein
LRSQRAVYIANTVGYGGFRSRYKVRVLVLAFSVAACGGKGGSPGTSLSAGDDGPALQVLEIPEPGELYHGVFPAGTNPDPESDISKNALDAYESAVGRRVAYVYFDDDWLYSRAFPTDTVSWIRDRGSVPFIRLMMRSQKVPLVTDPVFTLDRIIGGEFDPDLVAWAEAARRLGTPLIVEYGTEVNGDWNPWSAPYNGGLDVGPGKFKQAYRHIVTVMRGRGARNITWALHYNSENFPGDNPRNVPAAYYPGDDFVDWVGISVYGSERSNDRTIFVAQVSARSSTPPLYSFGSPPLQSPSPSSNSGPPTETRDARRRRG